MIVNVFAGSERSLTEIRFSDEDQRQRMERTVRTDPFYDDMKNREQELASDLPPVDTGDNLPWIPVPKAKPSEHIWVAKLPADLEPSLHSIQVKTTDMFGEVYTDQRSIRVTPATLAQATETVEAVGAN